MLHPPSSPATASPHCFRCNTLLAQVKVPTPKRPTLNEILTGQAAAAARAQSKQASTSSSSTSSNGSSFTGSSLLNGTSSSSSASSSTSSFAAAMSAASKPSSSNGSPSSTPAYASTNGKFDMAAAAKALGSTGRAVRVKFTLQNELPFGQSLKLVGSHPALGAWDETRGLSMTWGDGHVWTGEVPLPIGTAVEFKVGLGVDVGVGLK